MVTQTGEGKWLVLSSTGIKYYIVNVKSKNLLGLEKYHCNCEAYKYSKDSRCKHTIEVHMHEGLKKEVIKDGS